MRRRFLHHLLLLAPVLVLPASALPQTPNRIAHVAYVYLFSEGPSAPFADAFRGRMKKNGWIEGKNVQIEVFDAGGDPAKLAAIMQKVVASNVDVIVGACTPEAKAAVKVTQTIPIVMAATGDPVAAGLAQSLARPGKNVTGVSAMLLDLSAKRLDLLKTAFPSVSHATVVFNPERPDNGPEVNAIRTAASKLGVKLDAQEVRSKVELADALQFLAGGQTQALLNVGDTLVSSQSQAIVDFAAKERLPALYENREYVDRGGLMSYGPNFPSLHRRAADYVDKILKGAKPSEMPSSSQGRSNLSST